MAASHVGVLGSPMMGKTWFLIHNFIRQIFITFVSYDRLEDHLKSIVNKGKNAQIVILDELSVKKYPTRSQTNIDVLVIDCSKFKPRRNDEETNMSFQKWLIDTQMQNSGYYSTIVIDEAHNVLHSYSRTSSKSIYLDHFLEARNYGQRTVIATQKPQLISPSAYDMFQQIVAFKLTGKNAVKSVDEILQYWGIDSFVNDNKKLKKHEYKVYKSVE